MHNAVGPSGYSPNAEDILRKLKAIFHGQHISNESRLDFTIARAEFTPLFDDLLNPDLPHSNEDVQFQDWCRSKLRWDWNFEQEQLTLRTPNVAHNAFIRRLSDGILEERDRLAKEWRNKGWGDAARILDMIQDSGHTTVVFDHREMQAPDDADMEPGHAEGDTDGGALTNAPLHETDDASNMTPSDGSRGTMGPPTRREADIVLSHELQSQYPTFIAEVASPESLESLHDTCQGFIGDSDNFVKTAIGFKIPYLRRPSNRDRDRVRQEPEPQHTIDMSASVSLYRSVLLEDCIGDVETSMKNVEFRNADGTVQQGVLDLKVRDFIPSHVVDNEDPSSSHFLTPGQLDETLARLSFDRIADMLQQAEKEQERGWKPEKRRFGQKGQIGTRKRKLTDDGVHGQGV
ncbi:hypothetical protein PRZ48_015048 [Zasmidium cellare]|uniref:Uncharacterized protein n=1 Tax=Zasmidium cellare TaxID=395010 RepID=A0ABR0DXH3_ZASCE|nr:hypothetical protein PRZ48_015048 [Zasmidium cellare]